MRTEDKDRKRPHRKKEGRSSDAVRSWEKRRLAANQSQSRYKPISSPAEKWIRLSGRTRELPLLHLRQQQRDTAGKMPLMWR